MGPITIDVTHKKRHTKTGCFTAQVMELNLASLSLGLNLPSNLCMQQICECSRILRAITRLHCSNQLCVNLGGHMGVTAFDPARVLGGSTAIAVVQFCPGPNGKSGQQLRIHTYIYILAGCPNFCVGLYGKKAAKTFVMSQKPTHLHIYLFSLQHG